MRADRFAWARWVVAASLLAALAVPAAAAPRIDEEEPAAEAPPVPDAPKPKSGSVDAQLKALNGRVDKQAKELAALKTENSRLKDQIKLLYSIVNKLAGLQQGK